MKIIFGFSKPKNKIFPIFSWLIRLFERSSYSHVYVRWNSDLIEESICYQASGTQVNFIGQMVFDKNIDPIHEYETVERITPAMKKKLVKFCVSRSGVGYGMKQIFGIALVKIFKLKKNPFSDGQKTFICSELAGTILEEIFHEDVLLDLDIAGPKDIEAIIKNSSYFKKIL